MKFDYVIEESLWVEEEELDEMAERVKNGEPAKNVVNEYIIGLDDCYYCYAYAFKDKIIAEVAKRARE